MDNFVTIIEVTNTKIKIIIGQVVDDKPFIIYSTSKDFAGLVENGQIVNRGALVSALKSFKIVNNAEAKLHFEIEDCVVILPPNGLEIFEARAVQTVLNSSKVIDDFDIDTAVQQIGNQKVPNPENEIFEILPIGFVLLDGRKFSTLPLRERSEKFEVVGRAFTLPKDMIKAYRSVFEDAGFRPYRFITSSLGLCELISLYHPMLKNYFIVDVGSKMTSYTLTGGKYPFASTIELTGFGDLISSIASKFRINENTALDLLNLYGIAERHVNFNHTIFNYVDSFGNKYHIKEKEFRNFCIEYLEKSFDTFEDKLESLIYIAKLEERKNQLISLPVILTGGLLNVPGVKELLGSKFGNHENVLFLESDVIGTSKENYCSLLGSLLMASTYKGSYNDSRAKVTPVHRVSRK